MPAEPRGLVWRNRAGFALMLVACMQMVGVSMDARVLTGVGVAWGLSPRPKVFSDAQGLEGFASRFTVRWREQGLDRELLSTPEIYERVRGPYNRRNVYGAVIAYWPKLDRTIWEPVLCYGLVKGYLREDLGIPRSAKAIEFLVETKTRGRNDRWIARPDCRP